jgi:hypothetical protein
MIITVHDLSFTAIVEESPGKNAFALTSANGTLSIPLSFRSYTRA